TGRYAAFQSQTEVLAFAFQPIDESLARDDRCGRHRDVGFRSRPLLKDNVAPMPHQGLLDYARVCELVRKRPRAARLSPQQILDHPCVSPSEQPVQISKLLV